MQLRAAPFGVHQDSVIPSRLGEGSLFAFTLPTPVSRRALSVRANTQFHRAHLRHEAVPASLFQLFGNCPSVRSYILNANVLRRMSDVI